MKNSPINLVFFVVYCLLDFVQEIEHQSSRRFLDLIYYFQNSNFQTHMFDLLLTKTLLKTFDKAVYSIKASSKDKVQLCTLLSLYNYDFGNRQYIIFPGGFIRLYNQLLADPNLSLEEKMRFEIFRLASFSQASYSFRGCSIKLAKGGFYYIQESNSCKCAFCGIEKNDWEYYDDTDVVHRSLNPNCPLFTEEPGSSLETNYSIENGDNRQQPTFNLQEFMESPAVSNGGYVSGYQSASSLQNQALYPKFASLNNRNTSFGRWPNSALSPDSLAEAGFFYTGTSDWVTCAFCGVKLRNWQADCDPLIEHAHSSPECRFIRKKGHLFIQLVQGINLRSSLLSVEESRDNHSMPNDNRQAVQNYPKPRYPEYSQMRDRMSTFHGWKGHSNISQKEMAKSGLFYTGVEDRARCFFCGIDLYQWEEGDEPLVEHARHSLECPYLRQISLNKELTISDYIRSKNHQVETIEQNKQESEESIQLSNEQPSSSISESNNLTSNNEDQSQSTSGSHTDACQSPEEI